MRARLAGRSPLPVMVSISSAIVVCSSALRPTWPTSRRPTSRIQTWKGCIIIWIVSLSYGRMMLSISYTDTISLSSMKGSPIYCIFGIKWSVFHSFLHKERVIGCIGKYLQRKYMHDSHSSITQSTLSPG